MSIDREPVTTDRAPPPACFGRYAWCADCRPCALRTACHAQQQGPVYFRFTPQTPAPDAPQRVGYLEEKRVDKPDADPADSD